MNVEFIKGTFSVTDGEKTITISMNGTITSYTGRTVKRFPKGFNKTNISNNINDNIYSVLFDLIMSKDENNQKLASVIERLWNVGLLRNCNNINYYEYYGIDSGNNYLINTKFKTILDDLREFEEQIEGEPYNLYNFYQWVETKVVRTSISGFVLEYYGADKAMEIVNYLNKRHNIDIAIINKIMSDISVRDYYIISRSSIYTIEDFIIRYIELAKCLDMKIETKNVFHIYAQMLVAWELHKNDYINATLAKNQKPEFAYENDDFIVIVPTTLEELKAEGKAQHNCVGDYWITGYGNDLSKGKQTRGVVFIRRKSNPTKSYITCDFRLDNLAITQYNKSGNASTHNDTEANNFKREYQQYLYSLKK